MTGSRHHAGTLGPPAPQYSMRIIALIALSLLLVVALAGLPGTVRAQDDRSGTASVEIHDYQCPSMPDRDLDGTIRWPAANGCWPLASTAFTFAHGEDASTGAWMWATGVMGGEPGSPPARANVRSGDIFVHEWILPGVATTPRVFCSLRDGDYTEYSVTMGNSKGQRVAYISAHLASGDRFACAWLHLADDAPDPAPTPQLAVPLDPDVDIPRVDEEPRYPLPTLVATEPTLPTLNTPVVVEPSYPAPTLVPVQPTFPAVQTPADVPPTIPVIDVPVVAEPRFPPVRTPVLDMPVFPTPVSEPPF